MLFTISAMNRTLRRRSFRTISLMLKTNASGPAVRCRSGRSLSTASPRPQENCLCDSKYITKNLNQNLKIFRSRNVNSTGSLRLMQCTTLKLTMTAILIHNSFFENQGPKGNWKKKEKMFFLDVTRIIFPYQHSPPPRLHGRGGAVSLFNCHTHFLYNMDEKCFEREHVDAGMLYKRKVHVGFLKKSGFLLAPSRSAFREF